MTLELKCCVVKVTVRIIRIINEIQFIIQKNVNIIIGNYIIIIRFSMIFNETYDDIEKADVFYIVW